MLRKISLSTAILAGLFANSAFSASTTGDAQVIIRSALGISQTQAMNFGRVEHDNTVQTVTVSSGGAVTCGGAYLCTGGTQAAGQFTITGTGTSTVNVTRQDGILSDGSGHTTALTPTSANTIALVAGSAVLNVGGSFSFTPVTGQESAVYSTSNSGGQPYVISVNY